MARFFIDRPVLAAVLSIFILLAGVAALPNLPIAQYPEIAPPMVRVTATYPGASAEVVEQTVAAPLENQLTGVDHMLYMSSNSTAQGVVTIDITFEIGSNVDQATVDVNNLVRQAEPRLPAEVRRQGVQVTKSSSSFLQVISFFSPDGKYDDLYISNYLTLNVLDALKRIPGTTNITNFGAKDYAMRIWLQPDRLTQLGLTTQDVLAAVQEQNAQYAAGKIGQPPVGPGQELVYTIATKGRLEEVGEFANILIRVNPDGSALRLKDVARVELGARDYDFIGRINGRLATPVGIFLRPGANALATADAVKATLAGLAKRFPEGLAYDIPYDTTRFVEVSIREVLKTLAEAMVLVTLVVFVFLQNVRATLIPTLAVPVSLLGTFAGLYVLDYSINTLTLFGMVLAIGIVVDDAIVVLENVERIMHEEHLAPREAAIKAMQEVTGPVVAIVLVLCAVFVPVAFLGGLTGELYRQFAVTIAVAVVISGFVALTLTPSLCVLILRPQRRDPGVFFRTFNRLFGWITTRYVAGVGLLLRRSLLALTLFLVMSGLTAYMWLNTAGSLVPEEDQGFYIGAVFLPDGASLQRTDAVVQDVVRIINSNPANRNTFAFTGMDFLGGGFRNNAATIFVSQSHWDERDVTTQALVGEQFAKTGHMKEALVLAFNPPPIMGLGQAGGFELYLQNIGTGGAQRMNEVTQAFIAACAKSPLLGRVQTLWRANAPQLRVDLDRQKARAMGVSVDSVFSTLGATLGTYYVNDFNKYGRTWQVLLSADSEFRRRPEDIRLLSVRSASGAMVNLSSLVKLSYAAGPDALTRFNNRPAVKLFGQGAPGVSTGQALQEAERIAAQVLPPDYAYDWGGASFQEKRAGATSGKALVFAVIMVFLILAAQYGQWVLPMSILLAMPFGIFGALSAVWGRNLLGGVLGWSLAPLANDVYFQIGLVTLLGLAAKNAILIVEYAVLKRHEGMPRLEAALAAARLRFRPILMTSMAFILGVLPLVLSTGAGAGARQSVGTGVMGGMLAATFLAVFFVPTFFFWLSPRQDQARD